jgi:hypothetical protein
MRYLSLILLVSLVFLTWKVSKIEAKVNVRVHHDIQMDLSKIISAAIKAQLPNAYDIKFDQLFSETIDADHVRVLFEYSFRDKGQEDQTATNISGQANVTRNSNDKTQWTLEKIDISQSSLEFKDGLVVTREGLTTPEDIPTPESEESLKQ